jgi:hypothetical protein
MSNIYHNAGQRSVQNIVVAKRVKDFRSLGSYVTKYKISISSRMWGDIMNIEEKSKIRRRQS